MTDQSQNSTVGRFQRIALIVGVVGLAAGVIGALTGSMERFFQAYLFAFMFYLGLSLGSLVLLMLTFVTGGRWGLTLRRVNEAAAGIIWLMAILFIPLLLNLSGLYLWANPAAVQASPVLQEKAAYLNVPFFIARAVVYFTVWILLAFFLNRLSARWEASGDPEIKGKMRSLGSFGLILFVLTMTFASIDWMMSLDPFWNSSVYGLLIILGQMLSSLAFSVLILNVVPNMGLGHEWNQKTTPIPYRDLGALMLTFVMGWTYLAYFQFLIIWAGNIPHEVDWYISRMQGGWLAVILPVILFQFILPFSVLLSNRVRHDMRLLSYVAGAIVFFSLVNIYWLVMPAFYPSNFNLSWLDIVLPIGLGGIWLSAFFYTLQRRPALNAVEQESLSAAPGHQHAVS